MARSILAAFVAAALVAGGCGGPRPAARTTGYVPTERECIDRFRPLPGHPSRAAILDRPSAVALRRLALDGPPWRTDFRRHLVSLCEFVGGGVARDGIPPIDHPRHVPAAVAARSIAPDEPVVVVAHGGGARAYPLRYLVWHEVVNDRLGGRPVLVTYCPLCNSAAVFDRRVAGRTMTFGVSGTLRRGNLVLWDRRTQSWWQQLDGRALVGALAGRRLAPVDAFTLGFAGFRRRWPHGDVLARPGGFTRPYGRTPYPGYASDASVPPGVHGRIDPRLRPKTPVALVRHHGDAVAVTLERIARARVVDVTVGGAPIALIAAGDMRSVLDAGRIARARRVTAVAAFDRHVRRGALTFARAAAGRLMDAQTHSLWTADGRAIAGPLRGATLRPVAVDDALWFAVATLVPGARLVS